MKQYTITKAQFSHAVRAEVRWFLSDENPPEDRQKHDELFRARLEKSLKETGAYGTIIERYGDLLEQVLRKITESIQLLIIQVITKVPDIALAKEALTTLEEETTKIIDNA